MNQVEVVALWAGLIASIAGIVLSVAALVFGVWVNNRSTAVSDQTIRSLQKIESTVERLSDDTRSLIKAGWDKMLGRVEGASAQELGDGTDGKEPAEELASGLASEARAELGLTGDESPPVSLSQETAQRIERVLDTLEQSVAAQLKNSYADPSVGVVDRLVGKIKRMAPEAHALLSVVAGSKHIDRKQYQGLRKSSLKGAVRELRNEVFWLHFQVRTMTVSTCPCTGYHRRWLTR
jgi:hypothetical protein